MDKQIKKRVFYIITAVIAISIIYAVIVIKKDAETGNIIIKHNLFSAYTYEIYDDHVTLLEYGRTHKRKVIIPDTIMGKPVTEIGSFCFTTASDSDRVIKRKHETVQLGKNIHSIGMSAFMGCNCLKEVLGDVEIEEIGSFAFFFCTELERIEFRMQKVNTEAFGYCNNLREINTDSEMTYIGDSGFYSCSKLTSVGRQDKLEHIGKYAFSKTGINEFETNTDVDIRSRVFENTPLEYNTEQLIVGGLLIKYEYNGDKPYIIIPDNVKCLDHGCIYGYVSDLREIYIPDSVREIRGRFFYNGDIMLTLYIPDSVEAIAKDDSEQFNKKIEKIVTTKGSYAQEYAEEYDIPYEIVDSIKMPEE